MINNTNNSKKPFDDSDLKTTNSPKTLLIKRIIAIAFVIITVALMLWLGYFVTETVFASFEENGSIMDTAANFKQLIQSYGNIGILVAFGIQVLQVIVSPIPGQVIEIGMGLCYGWFWGAFLCLAGSAVGAAIILAFVKKFGIRAVELFVPIEKINEMKFINNNKKLGRVAFILYAIPGTPKDPLIFFFGLTRISILDFVIIQTIARTPAMITTTLGGQFLADKNFLAAAIIFVVTGVISLACIMLYNKILEALGKKKNKKEQDEK